MKTVRVVHGVLHMPSHSWAPTIEDIASLPVMTGDRSITVVRRGETVELSDMEACHLIQRGVAIEVER